MWIEKTNKINSTRLKHKHQFCGKIFYFISLFFVKKTSFIEKKFPKFLFQDLTFDLETKQLEENFDSNYFDRT